MILCEKLGIIMIFLCLTWISLSGKKLSLSQVACGQVQEVASSSLFPKMRFSCMVGIPKKSADKSSSEKGSVHSDMWLLDPKTWEWNKVKKVGMFPGPHAGFSICVHKKRAVLFGGVIDKEAEGDVIISSFLNELYGYPLELRKEKSTKEKSKGSIKSDHSSNGYMPKNIQGEEVETVVEDEKHFDSHTEALDMVSVGCQISLQVDRILSLEDFDPSNVSAVELQEQISNSEANDILPQVVKPCGRINSCMVVARDTLYLYGGMMEIRDGKLHSTTCTC